MDENKLRLEMQNAFNKASNEIASVRTGRANPGLLENLEVKVYGGSTKMRLLELGSITAPDPQSLVISPWDKSIIGEIRKGIMESNIGFNPSIDGEILRISIPPMTQEDRERYVKIVSQKAEEGRIEIRKVRGNYMHLLKEKFEKKEITEDVKFGSEKKVQEVTDEFIGKINDLFEKKSVELKTL